MRPLLGPRASWGVAQAVLVDQQKAIPIPAKAKDLENAK
jgi:hypothetical protein